MTKGIDTTFLVQLEVLEHPLHKKARALFVHLLDDNTRFAIAPQVLAEFIHVVTDPRRFESPLSLEQALARADFWWNCLETVQTFPNAKSSDIFMAWMTKHRLGRKRLLDTLWAATMFASDVDHLVTSNPRDFSVFGCFKLNSPQ